MTTKTSTKTIKITEKAYGYLISSGSMQYPERDTQTAAIFLEGIPGSWENPEAIADVLEKAGLSLPWTACWVAPVQSDDQWSVCDFTSQHVLMEDKNAVETLLKDAERLEAALGIYIPVEVYWDGCQDGYLL